MMRHDRFLEIALICLAAFAPLRHADAADAKADAGVYYLRPGDVVLFLGDSITAETKYYWVLFSDDLKKTYPEFGVPDMKWKKEGFAGQKIKFINGGVSGETAGDGLKRLAGLIETHKPTVCVVCFGMNDRVKDRAGYAKNLQSIVRQCKENKIAVTVLSSPCVDTISQPPLQPFVKVLEEMTAEARQIAEAEGAIFADCFSPFRKFMEDRKRALSYGDGIHPNDGGHRLMADVLQKAWGFGLPLAKDDQPRPSGAPKIADAPKLEKRDELLVWSGDLPVGQTWAQFGPKGYIKVAPKAGMNETGRGLELHLDGDGYRGGGLNWKGWYPADACDDVSRFTALVFYIRQITKIDSADLTVALMDNLKHDKGAFASNALAVLSDGGLDQIDGQWRRVVLPLNRFTQGKPLNLSKLWQIDFSSYGNQELTFQIDRIGFAVEKVDPPKFKSGPAYAAAAQVHIDKAPHTISAGIYGVCGLSREKLIEYRLPITRWGGNPSTRYNWRLGVDAAGNDWFFRNRGKLLERPADTGYLTHIESNQVIGATTYQTVPMIGWVAKDGHSYSYSIAKYGPQKSSEPGHADVGNGTRADGKPVTGNDPRDTSVPAPPEFIGDAVRFVVKRAGKADSPDGIPGVKYWALDNEPMIWHSTHRDVFPEPLGYDELWERTVGYAEAIKKADPTAKVAGFCSWGWTDLAFSAKDGKDNYRAKPDFMAHGKVPLGEWFIQKCAEYKKQNGRSLVDVFDIHWYPQGFVKGQGAYLGKGLSPELNAYRMRSTRDLWDKTYDQEKGVSWIRNTDNYSPVALLPRVREWIDKHNPGMEICLGEYNFGGADNITGGLAQAETFGVLARERLDLAFIWYAPAGTQELAWQLFRSYDGNGHGFGDQFLDSSSDNSDLSVFAARRKEDGAITIAVINKNLHGSCKLGLDAKTLNGPARVWRFDQETGDKVIEIKGQTTIVNGKIEMTMPAASASMIVVLPPESK